MDTTEVKTTDNATAEVATNTTEATAPVTTTPAPAAETVSSAEYKKLQREISKRDTAIRELETKASNISSLTELVNQLRLEQAELYDHVLGNTLVENQTTSETSRLAKIKGEQEKGKSTMTEQQYLKKAIEDIKDMVKDHELEYEDPKIQECIKESSGPADATRRLNKLFVKLHKEEVSKIQKEVDETVQTKLRESGVYKVDTGTASGSTRTFKESQVSDPKFWAEHKDEILKAQREGRIKLGE